MKNTLIRAAVQILRPKEVNRSSQERFLILSTTGLGDTLWGTPAIRALRREFPKSHIAILTSPIGKEVLLHNPHVDAFYVAKDPVFLSLASLYNRLRKENFTHIFSFHTSQRPILPLAAILGAQEVVGTAGQNKGLDALLTKALPNIAQHEITRRLCIVGGPDGDPEMELFLSIEEEREASAFLEKYPRRPWIAIHPGAKDLFKQWEPAHFATLCQKLSGKLGGTLFLTGTPQEKKLVDAIAKAAPGTVPITNLPLRKAASLLKQMDLLVSNDTGPMHIGFALKVPTVALFTPTNPALCGPLRVKNAEVIAKPSTCTPCLRKKCQEPFCLLQIGVSEVYDTCLKLYEKSCHSHPQLER
ncbi:MAG: glycosyltransferase family 9 protein [Verrucomicrobia bacterium]|nr:glycosyltransferase family 9 protein [Verrucomicrobiota bacterium]